MNEFIVEFVEDEFNSIDEHLEIVNNKETTLKDYNRSLLAINSSIRLIEEFIKSYEYLDYIVEVKKRLECYYSKLSVIGIMPLV